MISDILPNLLLQKEPIGVVGLGYVGLPLACLLAEKYRVIGFDISEKRVEELRHGIDRTDEVNNSEILMRKNITYTTKSEALKSCRLIIVAVPTPVDEFRVPDLTPVVLASKTVGKNLTRGSVVVYESTVYPGLTETVCAKHISESSGLMLNEGFFLGYSPERVVPGDKQRTIEKIVKIVSGSQVEVTDLLAQVYGSVIPAGIHKAPSIAVAEAAKVIENTQRDLNIALVNELSMLFDRIGLDTLDVLEAAGTKWNFLPFRPGLVGGHCIGVDPYYLTHLAANVGFQTQVISAGRTINDVMGTFVAQKAISLVLGNPRPLSGRINVGIMGITFKENVPDIRNSKVESLARALEGFGVKVHVTDPLADQAEVLHEYNRNLCEWGDMPKCDAIILAVTHKEFLGDDALGKIRSKLNEGGIVLDLKGALSRSEATKKGIKIWRL